MSQASVGRRGIYVAATRTAFWCYLGLWTALLLVPEPENLLLFWRGAVPDVIASGEGGWDKLVHASGYLVLFLLTVAAYGTGPGGFPQRWVFAACAAQGGLTEFLQLWVPSRQTDLGDWLADVAGLAVGVCLLAIWRRLRRARIQS